MNIGDKIKYFKTQKGISGKKLAETVGVVPSQIYKIESNVTKPSLDTLEKICNALDITISEFFSEPKEASHLPPELSKLAEKYNYLNEDEKNALKALLKLIIKE